MKTAEEILSSYYYECKTENGTKLFDEKLVIRAMKEYAQNTAKQFEIMNKTAIEIINEIDPLSVRHDIAYLRVLDCMKAYAKQVAEQALKDASENALSQVSWVKVNKQSILNTEIKLH